MDLNPDGNDFSTGLHFTYDIYDVESLVVVHIGIIEQMFVQVKIKGIEQDHAEIISVVDVLMQSWNNSWI